MPVGPLEGLDDEALLALLGHGNDHDPPTRPQDPFCTRPAPEAITGRVEEFQREAHEDRRPWNLSRKGGFSASPHVEIHSVGQVLPVPAALVRWASMFSERSMPKTFPVGPTALASSTRT